MKLLVWKLLGTSETKFHAKLSKFDNYLQIEFAEERLLSNIIV